ncbi:uncharacterized protein LOC6564469 [Drosophila grimshawi]|uniref:GH12468 n=1 Tax=Drosophila grimshawi TaxID=7222 RepID=B4JJD3_DROGR|nr:uncharacterized protein LOC6564469 [Drosophila grimshawi]EDV99685.1 GH12468 [Drosophila grimshawi]
MCDTPNLIDLTGWDEPVNGKANIDNTHSDPVLIESKQFKGPYDPFDSMEKEACIKGLHITNTVHNCGTRANNDSQCADQDLSHETPTVALELEQKNDNGFKTSTVGSNESRQRSLQQLAKLNATRLSSVNTPSHNPSTRVFSFFENSILAENLQMIAAESPIKLIEDETSPIPLANTAVTALSDGTCSNMEFETRLKMLRIAILESPSKTESHATPNTEQELIRTTTATPTPINVPSPTPAPTDAMADVGKLLQDMKSLICEHVDISKREQCNVLFESLSAAIYGSALPSAAGFGSQKTKESPSIYKRQGTFDLDLERQKKNDDLEDCVQGSSRNVQDIPDVMTCSSATYIAESHDKPASPISDTGCPKASPVVKQKKTDSYVKEVVDENLTSQINEILERHNLTRVQHYASDHNETESGGGGATVILVVNSAAANQLPSGIVYPKSAKVVPTANQDNLLRRRSSSLSIHDKTTQDRPKIQSKQSSVDNTTNTNIQTAPLKELSNVGDKLNVMTSVRQRRYSFSVGSIAGKMNATAAAAAPAQSRALLSGRNKSCAMSGSNVKCVAPTKANIPVKRVVPMIKTSLCPEELNSLNTTTPRCNNGQETPIAARANATGGKIFYTSTPMPQVRTMTRRSLRPVSNYSSAYSKNAAQ